jgi:hypothetical protein
MVYFLENDSTIHALSGEADMHLLYYRDKIDNQK